ncbi:MAG TPA: hypothetical protein VFP40_07515 [Terriglobales bacterium]|nr:hypothetical protein [Terriglobales bacterium]
MKKFLVVIAFVMGLAFLNPISAQNTRENQKVAKAEREATKAAAKNKAIDLTGTLRKEGDKTTFINEESQQSWTVANPDMLMGHESMRVKLKATPDVHSRTLLVEEVKDLKPLKQPKPEVKAAKRKKRALIF